jgi:ABC-type proline/glycine betaine transport system permease subunit
MSVATAIGGAEPREIEDHEVSVEKFAGDNADYYSPIFEKIQRGTLPRWHMNLPGLLIPWLWSASRGLWMMFWLALAFDVIGLVCLMQIVKYSPLLAEALLDPSANTTLVGRYTRWINVFGWTGSVVFTAGRLCVASYANRWYFKQYSRWRIDNTIPSGRKNGRVLIAVAILAFMVPITLYRATQQRLDERTCFNQDRAIATTERLFAIYETTDAASIIFDLTQRQDALAGERAGLIALETLTDEQNARVSEIRDEQRQARRRANLVGAYGAISGKDRVDCFLIDDFPSLARLVPPEDATYRRIPDEAAIAEGELDATMVLKTVKDPVEGRTVNIFTYYAESIDIRINYLRAQYAGIFDAMTNVLRQSLIRVEIAFMLTPWPVVAGLVMILAWAYCGTGTVIFVGSSLAFLAVFEIWQIAMQTMALVIVSTAVCIFIGLPIGIWMAKNKIARWITEPILDVMQTIPSLSYLVPAVAFFGISQPPAVLATVIFAMPPMIKLTALGIRQVPESTKEAALAFGATGRQLLTKVELPMAVPSIMAGLNQTIMLALSMATISAFIGAEGLGAIVISSLGDAQAGKGLLAGIAIALVAMVIDRILRGIRENFSRI